MRRLSLFSLVLLCFLSVLATAQSNVATITGRVEDPQGAVIPNATVTATNEATGISHTAKTTGSGLYTIPELPPGTYDVKAEAPSFASGQAKGVKLNVGDSRDVNFHLTVGTANQTVEVTGVAPLIETTKTDVSSSVTDLDMQQLPTFAAISGGANDFASLALTAPGVKSDTSTLTGDLIGPGSINNRANLYNVDGANITDQLVSGRDGIGASVDEIQEFQVLTNNYNAEYGQAGGLIVNAVTKSGTNKFHGDGHMYFRGRNLQASSPFYNINLFQKAIPASAPATAVPTPRCPDADFTGATLIKLDGCDRVPFHRKEGGFTFGGPLKKDKLFFFGSYELSRQGAPLILTPPTGVVVLPQPINNLLWSGKLDYKISDKHIVSARFNVDRILQDNLIVQTSNNVTPNDLTSNIAHVSTINTGVVSSFTPTLVNEARFAFVRTLTSTPDKTTLPGQLHSGGFITGANFCCPQGGLNKRYQYIDNVTWTHGKHSWKTGFNVSYYPWFSLFQQFHFGQWGGFTTPTTPTSFTVGSGPGAVTSKDNIYGFYVQDTWKLFHNFTVNYGLRYDVEAGAFKGGTVKGPNGTCFQGNGIIPACSSDYNNWQPRLGFTWEVRKGTLFKASAAEVTMLAFNNVVLDSLNFDGKNLRTVTFTPSSPNWTSIVGAFPNAPSATLLSGGPACPPNCGRVRPISSHLHNPEIHMFNASIQHEITKTLVAEVQYIGQFGSGLFGERDVNAPVIAADPNHPGFFYFQNQPQVSLARPISARPDNRFAAIRTNENSRTSQYNGMLVSLTKRMSHHVSVNGSYTWSHAITSGEDFFGLSEPGDSIHIKPERGPAFNDVRHALNLSAVFDSGRWTERNIVRWFTNDVTLGFIEQLQSGRPYPFSTGTAGYADARFFGTGSETQQRPDVLPDGTISSAGIASFEGLNALISGPGGNTFLAPGITAGSCNDVVGKASCNGSADAVTGDIVDFQKINGSLKRDAGLSSPFARLDMSMKKAFRIPRTESVKLELQADALNIFNHTNWQGFNGNNVLALLSLGSPTCTNCMRPNGIYVGNSGQVLHLSDITHGKISKDLLNPAFGGAAAALAGVGDPTTVDTSRLFQLSFHVRF